MPGANRRAALQSAWAVDSGTGIPDEYLIKLELHWRVLRRLGISYADELDEYERAVAKALAHDGDAAIWIWRPPPVWRWSARGTCRRAISAVTDVPIPKFATLCSTPDTNFGIERTLATL